MHLESIPARRLVALALSIAILAGCASTSPRYESLPSAAEMTPVSGQDRIAYAYTAPGVPWAAYRNVILEPIVIYQGQDHGFGKVDAADQEAIADYMASHFAKSLSSAYRQTREPGENTLRVRVTLTGIEKNTAVLSTVTKVVPVGAAINSVKTVGGKQGGFMGSVSYGVEVFDAASGRLLRAYVTTQYPLAMDVFSSFAPLDAAKAGVRAGSEALLAELK